MDISKYNFIVQAPALHDLSGRLMKRGERDTAAIKKILQAENLAPMIVLYAPTTQAKNTYKCWSNSYRAVVIPELDHRVLSDKPFDTLDKLDAYNDSWSQRAQQAIQAQLEGFHPICINILIVPGSRQAARLLTQRLLRPNDIMHHRVYSRKLDYSEAYLISRGAFDKVIDVPRKLRIG